MSQVRDFVRSQCVGVGALVVLFGATVPSVRADLITGTNSTGQQASVFVNFYTQPDGTPAPLVLSNGGTTIDLSLPDIAASYAILFAMKVNGVSADLKSLLSDPTLVPPSDAGGSFSFTPKVGGQPYTISGQFFSAAPTSNWNVSYIPGIPGFTQAVLITFDAAVLDPIAADPAFNFSVADPNGNLVSFTDADRNKAPEPTALALAGLGVAGLAGCGRRLFRRREA